MSDRLKGCIIASCGHRLDDSETGVAVTYEESEGTVYATFCTQCAAELARSDPNATIEPLDSLP